MANTIIKKLMNVQQGLSVPKDMKNTFGNYNYRSCELILEKVKPLLKENELALTLSDEVVMIGDHNYIKATATLEDFEGNSKSVSALARESMDKKGMDNSQMTGATSSYARKYALNGLFAIDDNKDADTDEHKVEADAKSANVATKPAKVDEHYICEKCGKTLKPYVSKKTGNNVSIREHEQLSLKAYKKVYCIDCIEKMKAEQSKAELEEEFRNKLAD